MNSPLTPGSALPDNDSSPGATLDLHRDLLSIWAHDTGALLGILEGALGLIDKTRQTKDSLEALSIMKYCCQTMRTMNQNILSYNGEVQEVFPAEFELLPWLKPLLQLFKFAGESQHVKVIAPVNEGELPVHIHTDENKLTQIICNLLSNALKFSPKGGEVCVRVYTKGVLLMISVEDQGIGIAEENLELIFEPYQRINHRMPGIGLGLTLCKRNVEALRGKILVESELNEGSTFTVCLPLNG